MHIQNLREAPRACGSRPAVGLCLAGLLLAWQWPAQAQQGAVVMPASSPVSAPVASAVQASVVTPVVVDAAAAPQRVAPVAAPAAVSPLAESAEPVGNSTQRLLALQRSGALASSVPRPVQGEIAQRSRERYLKSFEREIPERFQSSVNGKSGQAAGGR